MPGADPPTVTLTGAWLWLPREVIAPLQSLGLTDDQIADLVEKVMRDLCRAPGRRARARWAAATRP